MKKLMKIFCAFFAVIIALCSKNIVSAQDRTDFNIQDGYLSKYAGTTPIVEIPDDVTTIGSGVFKKHTEITSVTIPNGVTVIESEAFSGCKNLQSVTLPNGLVSIEEKAFYGCDSFTNINIPGSVTVIGKSAFESCNKIANINISSGVQEIGSSAFRDNDYVTSVIIPDSVVSLGSSAFYSCDYLQEVTLSKSLTTIATNTFYLCQKMKKIKIPDGVQILERDFVSSKIEYLAIPDSVTSIGKIGTNKNLRIYCNTGTTAYNYAVENDIFYVPLANYESESSGASSGTTTPDTSGSSTGSTNTGSNTTTTTPDTSGNNAGSTNTGNSTSTTVPSTPTQPEKTISTVECINRKCVRVYFTDGTNGIYDVPQMTTGISNTITIKEGGKQYQHSVICPSFNLTIESIQAISTNKVQIKYSGDFVQDRNGSQIDPDFVIPGFTDAGGLQTDYDQVNKIMILTSPTTTKQNTLYTIQATNYDEGVVIFNQNSFYGYEPVVSEPVKTPVQVPPEESSVNNKPTITPPVEDTSTSTDSSNTGSNSSSNNSENNISSEAGWNNDYEEPEYDPPRLNITRKTLKRKKTFILRVNNAQSAAKWKIANKRIAKISKTKGYSIKVKGLRKGTTYITARIDGEVLRCRIKVK